MLTDRGLDAALSSVASRCTVPVQVEVDLPARPAAAIEGIAYFTVSELLQNVSKHAQATWVAVDVWRVENRLMLQVVDNGVGGADASGGSGLAGLAGRLDAVDGILVVDSPAGGPTRITAELPWRVERLRGDGVAPLPCPPGLTPTPDSLPARTAARTLECWTCSVYGRGSTWAGQGGNGGRTSWRTGCRWSSPRIQCCSGRA